MDKSKVYQSQDYAKHPFILSSKEVSHHLRTDDQTGLNRSQVEEAQKNYGPNKLEGEGGVQWYRVLLKQVSNAMILVRLLPADAEPDILHIRLTHLSGFGTGHGTFVRRYRLYRRRSYHCSHRPECRDWLLPRVPSGEEDGKFSKRAKQGMSSSTEGYRTLCVLYPRHPQLSFVMATLSLSHRARSYLATSS